MAAASGRVTVLGAGIVGLTSAVRIAEAGIDVDVIARDLPLETTSSLAAALWYPYRAQPPERVHDWARRSYDAYAAEADDPESGVTLRRGIEFRREAGEPGWLPALPEAGGFAHLSDDAVPGGFADGWCATLPVMEPSVYLPRLVERLHHLGGTLTRIPVTGLPEQGITVNCTGLAALGIAGDPELTPVRGQVLRVGAVPEVEHWYLDQSTESRPVYVVPRSTDVVVGGSADVGDYDLRPDDALSEEIWQRAVTLVPALAGAQRLGCRVGLRPTRSAVRLDVEQRGDHASVVHCYGHGGAGWTLAWGCADDVATEVAALVAG